MSLSFWGGIDPDTGRIIDKTHPLAGETVTDTIFCLPSSRGSCTASQVLLELILADLAPRTLVLRDLDSLICVGAVIAEEIFEKRKLDIVCVGDDGFRRLLESKATNGRVLADGTLILADLDTNNDEMSMTKLEETEMDEDISVGVDELVYNQQEIEMLHHCQTEADRQAHRVIFRYAHILADGGEATYLPITNAHIDGCTYIGPGGLEFARRLVDCGGKVSVPTTLNSVSTDRRRWRALQVPENRATESIKLGDAYVELGCRPSFTCAPYLLPSSPSLGQDIAWGESNAVVYANSMLGARTEKLADYLDICCAIAGIVPALGVHIPENRRPHVVLDATEVVSEMTGEHNGHDIDILFPILGHLCGSLSDGKVPILTGLEPIKERVTSDNMKAFCAAFGTTGTSPLIHVAGITAEALQRDVADALVRGCTNRRTITTLQVVETFQTLDSYTGDGEGIQLIALGNPHLSLSECESLASLIDATRDKKHPHTRVIACLSRAVYEDARAEGFISKMEDFGVEFINDTCWCMLLDEPIIPTSPEAKILSNSAKYAHYGPGLTDRAFRFGSLHDCVQAAATGVYARKSFGVHPSLSPLLNSQQRRQKSTAAPLSSMQMRLLRIFK
jgi:predicted aconitase/predicted aconitase with swiveling domain